MTETSDGVTGYGTKSEAEAGLNAYKAELVAPKAKPSITLRDAFRLMSAEAYWRKDHPGHGAAVAAVARRFAQLYPEDGSPDAANVDASDPSGVYTLAAEADSVMSSFGLSKVRLPDGIEPDHAAVVEFGRWATNTGISNATAQRLYEHSADLEIVSGGERTDQPVNEFLDRFSHNLPRDTLVKLADWYRRVRA